MTDINHVGITVGDIGAAIGWYGDVFGLKLLDGPLHCDTATAGAGRRADVFGPQWRGMKLAHMITANGGGVKLFQFIEPEVVVPDEKFAYWQVGPPHLALTVDDFATVLSRIVETAGMQRTAIYDMHGGALVCYCEDP